MNRNEMERSTYLKNVKQHGKLYLSELSKNIRKFGLKLAAKITNESFSNKSSIEKLRNDYQAYLNWVKQSEQMEENLIREHGYQEGKRKFAEWSKNNPLPDPGQNKVVAPGQPGKKEINNHTDNSTKHPHYFSLSRKYGHDTAVEMIAEIEKDPDFLNKLAISEKEDTDLKDHTNVSNGADGVNWDIINSLGHNKGADSKNHVHISAGADSVDWNKINNLDHNKEYDKNN